MIAKPKAILFDLDDTISSYDSACEPAWQRCCEDFVQKYHPTYTVEDLISSINHTRSWYWSDPVRHKIGRENLKEARREVVRYSLNTLEVTKEDRILELADNYTEMHNSMLALLQGSREALEMIKVMGVRMAVVTNGDSVLQREKLERFHVMNFFDKVIIDSEVGYSKPQKEIFQYTLDQLMLKPEDVWMVGDNLVWDIQGAQQLGIFTIWNDYRKKGLSKDSEIVPDLIVSSIYEMAELYIA